MSKLAFPIKKSIKLTMLAAACLCAPTSFAQTQEHLGQTEVIEVKEKNSSAESSVVVIPPAVTDGKINEGKKVTITELKELPKIVNNNLRQVFSQTPGLYVSEVANESFASISSRGLGDPHESFNILLLKDGLPIGADLYGYPANYYLPPVDTIDSVEVYRGGASLLYGPQPGGTINFISRKARLNMPLSLTTRHIVGSADLYNTYNEMSGGDESSAALGFFHNRGSNGFRSDNSDSSVKNGGFRFTLQPASETRVLVDLDAYQGRHGEAGGLSDVEGEGLAFIGDDRFQSTLLHDFLKIDRYAPTVTVEHDLDKSTMLRASAYGAHYSRQSFRQSYGDAPTFGGIPNGTTNTIQKQVFNTYGLDGRVIHKWGSDHTASVGATVYGVDSPFVQWKGQTPFATSGAKEKDLIRKSVVTSIFAENIFKFGNLSLTPGVRLENISQEIDERFNSSVDAVLRNESRTDRVPLFGFGAVYDISKDAQTYANISQGYKPTTFQDVVPLQTGDVISDDLDPSHSVTYEAGVRGNPDKWMTVDASLFWTSYRDQFGRVGNQIQNVGRGRYKGIDLVSDINLSRLIDETNSTNIEKTYGAISLFGNATILRADFIEGPLDGKTPQYAPEYLVRTGVRYSIDEKVKIAFLGNLVDSSFADDANSANRFIPKYQIWDLTAEFPVYKNVSLVTGINNIFDEEYTNRIRSNGIEPGNPRNWYAGVSVNF
jgi:Fe(3+) dicitrate transport protein